MPLLTPRASLRGNACDESGAEGTYRSIKLIIFEKFEIVKLKYKISVSLI